jgi:hypothetical protein
MASQSFWLDFAIFLFFWAGIAAFVLGLLIAVFPSLIMRAGEVLNRWISTERVFQDLDSPRSTERLFYRHHRIFGGLLMLGGAYILYMFAFATNSTRLAATITLFGSHTVAQWLLDSLIALNLVFAAVAIGIGFAVFFRPSMLKNLEASTNRWFAVDSSVKQLDAQSTAPDRLFARSPRIVGILIMLASAYIVLNLRVFLPH